MFTRKSLQNTILIIVFGFILVFSFNNIVSAQMGNFVTIDLDGVNVNIHYYNNPPAQPSEPYVTLIFFHGMPVSGVVWTPVMFILRSLANVDSYAISFPGYGQSDALSPDLIDYTEVGMSRVPFKFADAMGIDRFIAVVHDLGGGPWTLCETTKPENMARLDGLVAMNTPPASPPGEPYYPVPITKRLGELMADPNVPPFIIKTLIKIMMQFGTYYDVLERFPLVVGQITTNNTQDDNRLAIAKIIEEAFANPLGFGGRCHDTFASLDALEPLLVWGMDDFVEPEWVLEMFQELWPSAQTVEVYNAMHWVMLDQEDAVAEAIANYVNERLGSMKGSRAPTIRLMGKLPAVWANIKSKF